MNKKSILAIVFGVLLFVFAESTSIGANAAITGVVTGNVVSHVDTAQVSDLLQYVRGGRRGARGGARRSGGANVRRSGGANVRRNNNVNVRRNTNVKVHKNTNVNVRKNTNVNINRSRNVNVNIRHRGYGWRGARWGAIAFGVTMGTVIVVAASTPPLAPDPSLCWTWANSALTRGYWYYCAGP